MIALLNWNLQFRSLVPTKILRRDQDRQESSRNRKKLTQLCLNCTNKHNRLLRPTNHLLSNLTNFLEVCLGLLNFHALFLRLEEIDEWLRGMGLASCRQSISSRIYEYYKSPSHGTLYTTNFVSSDASVAAEDWECYSAIVKPAENATNHLRRDEPPQVYAPTLRKLMVKGSMKEYDCYCSFYINYNLIIY
jgi:hypothetical protein